MGFHQEPGLAPVWWTSNDLVHHSDRGSTYASSDYRKALEMEGIECSMSRKGDCWDNAVAESFFSTLKREMDNLDHLESWEAANISIAEYIDGFYNPWCPESRR
jgi:transposase InsO family protein